MKRIAALVVVAAIVVAGNAFAQEAPKAPQHGAQGGMPMMCPMMGGMQGAGGMHGGGMMGGSMNPMMMGMMGGGQMDAKARSQMLQMQGEMMKAMADVMLKHGRMMEGQPSR